MAQTTARGFAYPGLEIKARTGREVEMDMRRWILTAGCAALLIVAAGCVSDEVVYVDEQGNELAVDESGQPLVPGTEAAPIYVEEELPALTAPTPSRATPLSRPEALTPPKPVVFVPELTSPAPKADPNWDLPPAGAAPSPLEGAPARPKLTGTSLATPPQPSPKIFGAAPKAKAPAKKAPAKKAPAKKIDSSAGLDLPPAG